MPSGYEGFKWHRSLHSHPRFPWAIARPRVVRVNGRFCFNNLTVKLLPIFSLFPSCARFVVSTLAPIRPRRAGLWTENFPSSNLDGSNRSDSWCRLEIAFCVGAICPPRPIQWGLPLAVWKREKGKNDNWKRLQKSAVVWPAHWAMEDADEKQARGSQRGFKRGACEKETHRLRAFDFCSALRRSAVLASQRWGRCKKTYGISTSLYDNIVYNSLGRYEMNKERRLIDERDCMMSESSASLPTRRSRSPRGGYLFVERIITVRTAWSTSILPLLLECKCLYSEHIVLLIPIHFQSVLRLALLRASARASGILSRVSPLVASFSLLTTRCSPAALACIAKDASNSKSNAKSTSN